MCWFCAMRFPVPLLALHAVAFADLPATPIFAAGTLNHTCYRVPNAVRAPSGALLVFTEARGPSCDDQAPKDVMLSRSHDEGATWGPPEMVVPGWSLGGNLTFRNPYPVFTAGGALLLQVANSTTPPWRSLQLTSMDEGVSWSQPAPLAPSLGPFDGVLNGPGSGLLLAQAPHAGRLLTCGTTVYDTAFPRAKGGVVSVSDSAGAAWSITQVWTASPGGPAVGECQLAELRNGSVLATLRNEQRPRQPCSCRLASRSDDGGAFFAGAAPRAANFSPRPPLKAPHHARTHTHTNTRASRAHVDPPGAPTLAGGARVQRRPAANRRRALLLQPRLGLREGQHYGAQVAGRRQHVAARPAGAQPPVRRVLDPRARGGRGRR